MMNILATARRILTQLRHDRRTVALMLLVPSLVMVLLYYVIDDQRGFDAWAPVLLCVFPFFVMFLITSIATLRERTSGTLERLMASPLRKLDLLLGYGLAFGLMACFQVALALTIVLTWLGFELRGQVWPLVLVALLNAAEPSSVFWRDVAVVAGSAILALGLGAATLRRRTP